MKSLSRRTVLRGILSGGAAVTVPLPILHAMLNDNGTAYAAGEALPMRFGVWFHGIGNVPVRWNPTASGEGAGWALSEQLQAFENVKSHLTVVSGMNIRGSGTIHINGTVPMLTGAEHTSDHSVQLPSIDQVIAGLIGAGAPFKSLEAGLCRATANAPTDGTAWNFVSHTGKNAPNRPEYDARALFARLFANVPMGVPTTPAFDETMARGSILDLVSADIQALKRRVGAEDARRLDQHLTGISELHKRVVSSPALGAGCAIPAEVAGGYPNVLPDLNAEAPAELNAAMSELLVLALSCNLTRVFSFQWSRPAAHVYFRSLNFEGDFHDDIQHKEPGDQPKVNQAVLYAMDHLRVLMDKMKATPDGAGNLLDNTCVMATSDNALGRDHSTRDFPILLFGKAGGALKGDVHIRPMGDNPSKVLLTLANLYGANVTRFGLGECEATSGVDGILA